MINKQAIRKHKQRKHALKLLQKLYQTNSKFYNNKISLNFLLSTHKQAKEYLSFRGFQLIPNSPGGHTKYTTANLKQNKRWIGKPFSNWYDPIEVKLQFGSQFLREHLRDPNSIRIRNHHPIGSRAEWMILQKFHKESE